MKEVAFSAAGPARHPEYACARHQDDDVIGRFQQWDMREVNVSSVGDVHDQETAVAASEDRPDEQAEDVVQQRKE